MNWWVVRTLIVSEFTLVGLLFVCLADVVDFVYPAFMAIMVCMGFTVALLLEILEKIADQGGKKRGK